MNHDAIPSGESTSKPEAGADCTSESASKSTWSEKVGAGGRQALSCSKPQAKSKPWTEQVRTAHDASDIALVRAPTTGGDAWYYVKVGPGLMNALVREVSQRGVNLTDFGTIILSGFGKSPPQNVVKRMYEEYGFDPKDGSGA